MRKWRRKWKCAMVGFGLAFILQNESVSHERGETTFGVVRRPDVFQTPSDPSLRKLRRRPTQLLILVASRYFGCQALSFLFDL
jgi:hypothetical protein